MIDTVRYRVFLSPNIIIIIIITTTIIIVVNDDCFLVERPSSTLEKENTHGIDARIK
jgi:hypothetical protein